MVLAAASTLVAALVVGAVAQDTPAPADSQFVLVGQGPGYDPANLSVTEGGIVTFIFASPGSFHTVTQTSFDDPCAFQTGGFSSPASYTPFDNSTAGLLTLSVTNASEPVWFACAYHCSTGEVGVLNAPSSPSSQTYDAFVTSALQAGNFSNWDSVPQLGTQIGSGDGGADVVFFDFDVASPVPAPDDDGPPAPDPSPSDSSSTSTAPDKMSATAIAGAAVGSALGLIALVLLVLAWRARKIRKESRSAWVQRLEMSLRRAKESKLGDVEGKVAV